MISRSLESHWQEEDELGQVKKENLWKCRRERDQRTRGRGRPGYRDNEDKEGEALLRKLV